MGSNKDIRYHTRSLVPDSFFLPYEATTLLPTQPFRKSVYSHTLSGGGFLDNERRHIQTFVGMNILFFEYPLYLSCEGCK